MDDDGDKQVWVFQAMYHLRRKDVFLHEDAEKINELRDWFDQYLEPPTQFTKRRTSKETGTAISWYHDTAKEHIAKMYEMSRILEKYGIIVSVVRREDPGYIVYEDEYQVAAIPYREDRDKVI